MNREAIWATDAWRSITPTRNHTRKRDRPRRHWMKLSKTQNVLNKMLIILKLLPDPSLLNAVAQT